MDTSLERGQHVANLLKCLPNTLRDTPGSTQMSTYTTLSKSGLLCPPESSKAVTLRKPRDSDRT